MAETKRVTIYGRVDDGTLFRLGSSDLPVNLPKERFGGEIGTFLHRLAWYYEEHSQDTDTADAGVEDNGGNRSTPDPRMASYMGLTFWEVAPDEFVLATNYDEAVRLYGNTTQYNAEQIRKMYPAAIWENL